MPDEANEIREETLGGDKDYIISILEEMDEEELDAFDNLFRLIDKRDTLTHIIHEMDDMDENVVERLNSIYRYVRDSYWAGE